LKRLFFVLGIVFVVVLVGAGGYAKQMMLSGFSTRTPPGSIETALAQEIRNAAIPARYQRMKNPVTPDKEALREGMEHWADHCASCHANNGSGDTMYGNGMYPRPPDMRHEHTQEMSDGELYFTIENGIRLSGMPAFGAAGDNDLDTWKLVAFIRHLTALTQSEEMEMKAMNPTSPQEVEEEQAEESFLHDGLVPPQPSPSHHHRKDSQ
jgi:mono/diheme cytochrome c family protein